MKHLNRCILYQDRHLNLLIFSSEDLFLFIEDATGCFSKALFCYLVVGGGTAGGKNAFLSSY